MEFHWKCLNNCVMTEKKIVKNKSDGLCKLCECDSEDLMHVLCDCETIKEFWQCVIDLINVNINNNRYKYAENNVMLGCLNENFSMNEKQIVNFFILNGTWIVWKRRCCIKFEDYWINNQQTKQWLVASLKLQKQILMCSRNKKIQSISTKLVL